jgi:ribosomal protein S18 acetylase RimI-like enzyme
MTTVIDTADIALREEIAPSDRSRIFKLLSAGGFFTTREMAYAMNLLDRSFLGSEAGDFRFMLLEQKDILLGYGCYGLLPLCNARYHIYWMAIDRHHRGKGIGKRLEAAITSNIRKLGGAKIYAEISDRNEDRLPQHFYAQCGYKHVATIPSYYADGDSMLLLEKEL